MINKEQIEEFFHSEPIAVIGVSRTKSKFGYLVFKNMLDKGIQVIPVNPHTDMIDNVICYRSVEVLPPNVKAAILLTRKKDTYPVLQQLLNKNIKQIWMQQGAQTAEAIELAKKNYVNLIHGKCIMMFLEPISGIHKFHKGILKLFGKLPK